MVFGNVFCTIIIVALLMASIPAFSTGDKTDLRLRQKRKRETREVCPRGMYMDHATGHCDMCSPHCHRSSENPPSGCQRFCRQMMTSKAGSKKTKKHIQNCSEGHYYDAGTTNCDPCLPHCARRFIEEPPEGCQGFCNSIHTSKALPTSQTLVPKEEGKSGLLKWEIAVIALCVGIGLVASVGFPVIFYQKRSRGNGTNHHTVPTEETDPFKPSIKEETADAGRTELVTNTAV